MKKLNKNGKSLNCIFLIILSILLIFTTIPVNLIYAQVDNDTPSEMTTNMDKVKFITNESSEFTVTTVANAHKEQMVNWSLSFSEPTAVEKLEYYKPASQSVEEGQWVELKGDFSTSKAFPLVDATTNFRATFNTDGDYMVILSLNEESTNKPICRTNVNITVVNGTIIDITKIGLREFTVGNMKITALDGVYTGQPQPSVTITGNSDYYLLYRVGDAPWNDVIPSFTEAGEYTVDVHVTTLEPDGFVQSSPDDIMHPMRVTIDKADQKDFAFENIAPKDLVYNHTATYTAKGGSTDGPITYDVVSGEEYVTVNSATGEIRAIRAGGTAVVRARISGNDNYKEGQAIYTINTVKDNQSGFTFEKDKYTVQYGTRNLTVKATGGQSGGNINYEVIEGDVGTIESVNNQGEITFASGKTGTITVKATLEGGDSYYDIAREVTVEVKTNDFSNKYSITPSLDGVGWYTSDVKISANSGYMISTSGEFDATWEDSIVVSTEGVNDIGSIYLQELATGYIGEAIAINPIKIDKIAPTQLGISYSKSILDKVIEAISFGFYNAEMKVTVKGIDYVSKIERFEYTTGDGITHYITKDKLAFSGDNGEVATGSFKISPSSAKSIVTLTAYDAAGNHATISGDKTIIVDNVAPEISVSYDNNNVDSGYYFNQGRTATITIKEENFFKDYIYDQVRINNANGVPEAQGYQYLNITIGQRSNSSSNYTYSSIEPAFTKVGDTYQTTVSFTQDGEYTFDISFYDYSANKNKPVDYGISAAPTAFVIDKTAPTVEVTYDNNAAENSMYYKAPRSATIVVTERNFSADRVNITQLATDDGGLISKPIISNWVSNGDKHTATIKYDRDGKYVFNISVEDKAGNKSEYRQDEMFVIDTKSPTLEITGVADGSINKGVVAPVVTYSDTNIDIDKVKITLTGADRKSVELTGEYKKDHNGGSFVFANFEKKSTIDDIYTLSATVTDLAGNTTSKTITFSVNRFGSTYAMSDRLRNINGTYIKNPTDIVLVERNVNIVKNVKVTLFKNNETKILKEGTDYSVYVAGGNGSWYNYTYTIFANNFEKEGVYRLAVYSEDAAGNVSENTLDTKGANISFGVDTTAPNILVENLESGKAYETDNLTVNMAISDNLLLSTVEVYLDNYDTPYKRWSSKQVSTVVAGNGDFSFDIAGDSKKSHKVRIVATDAAGNSRIEEVKDFYVTTSAPLLIYLKNKTEIIVLLGGGIPAVVLITAIAIRTKKKTNKK